MRVSIGLKTILKIKGKVDLYKKWEQLWLPFFIKDKLFYETYFFFNFQPAATINAPAKPVNAHGAVPVFGKLPFPFGFPVLGTSGFVFGFSPGFSVSSSNLANAFSASSNLAKFVTRAFCSSVKAS